MTEEIEKIATSQKWFQKPYPLSNKLKRKLLVSLSFGFFIFLFLRFFQPFGLLTMTENKSLIVLGFAAITSATMLINYAVLPVLLPAYFDMEQWTTGKNIQLGVWNILVISLLNYGYYQVVRGDRLHLEGLLSFVIITSSVGIFPVTLLAFMNELYLTRKHAKEATFFSNKLQTARETDKNHPIERLVIKGDLKNDVLEIAVDELYYIQAVDNYSEVRYIKAGQLCSQLLRISLKNIESQLEEFPNIIRCHRSYMVNIKKISRIYGNARAYYLHFEPFEEQVPLSRGFNKEALLF